MTRASFFKFILALLFGWKLKPKNVICHIHGCDLYGHRHPGWHSQYLRDPQKVLTATDILEQRKREATGKIYPWPKPDNIIIPTTGYWRIG